MAIAAKQIVFNETHEEDEEQDSVRWCQAKPRIKERLHVGEGKTIPEVFLRLCDKKGGSIACVDSRAGMMTYNQLKMRALILVDYIRSLEGEYVGILLPASVGIEILILATQMAGKVPLMVNWTVGPRHLDSLRILSKVKVVLTSWAFVDRLENVDLTGIDDNLVMLEDISHHFGVKAKLKAFFQSRKSASSLMKMLGLDAIDENKKAVLLFTSGSESLPKGVPLSHKNILSNQRSMLEAVEIYNDDILLAMLPPFHSFGFTVTGLLCMVAGIRTAYSPDPKDGKRIARAIEQWEATIIGGTPTFIKAIMNVARIEQLKHVRFCFTGAEATPPGLYQIMAKFGKNESNFLVEGYGITECSPALTANRLDRPHKGVGQALPGVELCVVNPDTHERLPVGTQGLILVRGDNVFGGYLNPIPSGPFIFVEGQKWYKTGDLGTLDEKGYLTISGRQQRFIKVGAEMVSLAALEDVFLKEGIKNNWPVLNDAALAVCAKEEQGEKARIYLFVTWNLSVDDANAALREAGFSNLVRVYQVVQREVIPVMGSGKINYRQLESEYLN